MDETCLDTHGVDVPLAHSDDDYGFSVGAGHTAAESNVDGIDQSLLTRRNCEEK
jgi:hypothetical protein